MLPGRLHSLIPLCSAIALGACATGPRSPLGDPLPRGLDLQFTEESYGFTAADAREVADAMRRFGPQVGEHRVPAATSQEMEWDYQLARSGGACRIRGAMVHLEITMTLPDWIDRSRAPAPLQSRWTQFASALRRHEDGHLRLYLDGARALLRRLSSLPAGDCASVRRAVEEMGRATLERFGERNAAYDRDTNGGSTQGVCWPGFEEWCTAPPASSASTAPSASPASPSY